LVKPLLSFHAIQFHADQVISSHLLKTFDDDCGTPQYT
jgi:uncharacterized UPF0160 family protein